MARDQPVRTTYFEMNTLSNISQLRDDVGCIPGIDVVRRDLLSPRSKRTIVVSQHLLTEMAGYESSERRPFFEEDMAFLNQLALLKVFRAQGDLMSLEVQRAATGREFNPFIDAHFPIDYDDPEWKGLFEGERIWVKGAKKSWVQYERDAKARIDANHSDLDERKTQLTAAWQDDSHGLIHQFVHNVMISTREQLGLPDDDCTWPDPQVLRTLWCSWAYLLTRAVLIEILETPPKRNPSDVVDWLHYQSAAYADEFVTSDNDFLTIIREAPGPKPEILSLEEWVARLRAE